MFFYSDTAPRENVQIDPWKLNGTKGYMRHYEKYLFLSFMAKNGTQIERRQAEQELRICKRKLDWWEKHPNTNLDEIKRQMEKMNKDWASGSKAP